MEIPFKNILGKFLPKKKIKISRGHSPFGDWNLMLLIFVLGLITVFTTSFFIHQSFSNSKGESNREFVAKTFNEDHMQQILMLFEERTVSFEEAKNTPTPVVDPSI